MVYSFDEVGEILDDLYEEFPEALFQELNGGVCLLPEVKTDPALKSNTYIMGEYCRDVLLGRYINLYYGSFAALAKDEDWSSEDWAEELYTTLSHELTHHVEGLAGERGLEIKDEENMAQWLAEEEESEED